MVWGVDFDEDIYQRGVNAGKSAAAMIDGIRINDAESMRVMMEGQFESGFCMADFNNSAPASGSEHHVAHIWEMLFHWAGKEGLLHGDAVGVAMLKSAEWYAKLRKMSKKDAKEAFKKVRIAPRKEQEAALRAALPEIAEEVIASNPIYMQLSDPEALERVKARMLEKWEAIQTCAANVPSAEQLKQWFNNLGGPSTAKELGLSDQEYTMGMEYGLYLRERFSINVIRKLFGWE